MNSRTLYIFIVATFLGTLGLGNGDKLFGDEDPCTTVKADKIVELWSYSNYNLCISSESSGYGKNSACIWQFVVELDPPEDTYLSYYLVGSEDEGNWPVSNQDLCSKIAIDVTFYTARFFQGWGKRHSYQTRGQWQSGKCQKVYYGVPRFYPDFQWDKRIRVAVSAHDGWHGWAKKTIPARVNVIYDEKDLTCGSLP